MELKVINQKFTVCKIDNINKVDMNDPYFFIGKTDEELSLVCSTDLVPSETIVREDGWLGFRIQGILDFSLVGIIAKISDTLTKVGISIFVISTFNTDCVLIKEESFEKALEELSKNNYPIVR